MIPFLTAVFLAAPPVLALTTAQAEIVNNPNEHKLNQRNVTAPKPGNGNGFGQPGMAIKNSGVPQNGTTAQPPNRLPGKMKSGQ
jgi:hypothetical protein